MSYLAYDEMKAHTMSKNQASRVKESLESTSKKDKLMWNQVCPKNYRKRPCLPHGCRTLLLEVFAGCAMLSSVAHYSFGYPTSEPIDIRYDQTFDLTTAAGRAAADARIAKDDPYLLSFAPVCGPWSPWQHVNMSQSEETYEKIMADRKKWLPVAKWICETARRRLQRGRQVLIENPGPSELHNWVWQAPESGRALWLHDWWKVGEDWGRHVLVQPARPRLWPFA